MKIISLFLFTRIRIVWYIHIQLSFIRSMDFTTSIFMCLMLYCLILEMILPPVELIVYVMSGIQLKCHGELRLEQSGFMREEVDNV